VIPLLRICLLRRRCVGLEVAFRQSFKTYECVVLWIYIHSLEGTDTQRGSGITSVNGDLSVTYLGLVFLQPRPIFDASLVKKNRSLENRRELKDWQFHKTAKFSQHPRQNFTRHIYNLLQDSTEAQLSKSPRINETNKPNPISTPPHHNNGPRPQRAPEMERRK
jgi:hypothetical protein